MTSDAKMAVPRWYRPTRCGARGVVMVRRVSESARERARKKEREGEKKEACERKSARVRVREKERARTKEEKGLVVHCPSCQARQLAVYAWVEQATGWPGGGLVPALTGARSSGAGGRG